MSWKAKSFAIGFNTVNLVAGLLLVSIGIWMFVADGSGVGVGCRKWLNYPILISGICLVVISLIGFGAILLHVGILTTIYIILTSIFIVILLLMLAFAIFMFSVTDRTPNCEEDGTGVKNTILCEFRKWLEEQVDVEKDKWSKISKCLRSTIDCPILVDFYPAWAPIKNYCCFAPPGCPGGVLEVGNAEGCDQFSEKDRCWNCDQCGAKFSETINDSWGTVAIVTIVAVSLMVAIIIATCVLNKRYFRKNAYTNKGSTPNAGYTTPKAGYTTPKAESRTPRVGYMTPKAGPTTPRAEPTTPKAGSRTPRAEPTTPRGEYTTPTAGFMTPRAASTTPRAGYTSPKARHTPPKSPAGGLAMHLVPAGERKTGLQDYGEADNQV